MKHDKKNQVMCPETGLSCEMCHGPISVEDHAQCDICPECLDGAEVLTNQNQMT